MNECSSSNNDCLFQDLNNDGFDDVSFNYGYDIGAISGDNNLDGNLNVVDIVNLVNMILGNTSTDINDNTISVINKKNNMKDKFKSINNREIIDKIINKKKR